MNDWTCEDFRDVYPDVLHGRASAEDAEAARLHLAGCEACREEAAMLGALHTPVDAASGEFEQRVLVAVRQRPRRRFRSSDIAMAATLAAALIGGSVILRSNAPLATTQRAELQVHSVGAVSVEDAMLTGKASLNDLSVEQLEKLLGEMES